MLNFQNKTMRKDYLIDYFINGLDIIYQFGPTPNIPCPKYKLQRVEYCKPNHRNTSRKHNIY